jgi:alginate O-acetyltransferase complex protein AlgI
LSFNSSQFILFAALTIALYRVLPFRAQNRLLLIASCLFYGSWDWRYLVLLTASTSIDYVAGLRISSAASPAEKRRWLALSCAANLGVLSVFKYFNFFIESAASLLHALHLGGISWHLSVLLPVGISFYTFHAMSYTIDIYRGKLSPVKSYADYMLFVLFFPQLAAGPIARASSLLPQITAPRKITADQFVSGAWLIFWGYIKKCLVADNLVPMVNGVFASHHAPSGARCLVAVYAFALQIYGDFSGYTDIARGLGKVMGFELAVNFNLPYLASNPREFWQRWHISLSTWLRDYLYIPLGGNRKGLRSACVNVFITMLIGGLWHGAAWHFVIWGGYQGALLVIHRVICARSVDRKAAVPSAILQLQRFAMFQLTCFGWLIFRVNDTRQLLEFLRAIGTRFVPDAGSIAMLATLVVFGGILVGVEAWIRNADDPRTRPLWDRGAGAVVVTLLALLLMLLYPQSQQAFMYFQF